MKNLSLFLLAIAILSASAQALVLDNPKTGTFTLDENASSPVDFNPVPWVSPGPAWVVYMYPFASDDMYAGLGSTYNLAQIPFSNGDYLTQSIVEKTGDLGIRVSNNSGAARTFDETVMTLQFLDGDFDVYLPEFTVEKSQQLFFWVAESGSTYYANDSLGPGQLNIDASYAMAPPSPFLPSHFLAREVPEPATIILLSLGAVLIVKKR